MIVTIKTSRPVAAVRLPSRLEDYAQDILYSEEFWLHWFRQDGELGEPEKLAQYAREAVADARRQLRRRQAP